MPLVFQLKAPLRFPADASPLQVERVRRESVEEVGRMSIWYGNRQVSVAELFEISGSAEDDQIEFVGDCSRLKSIGAGQKSGSVLVRGHAGMHLGSGMLGGSIVVEGDAGNWVGAEMRRGRIVIRGNAGDHIGGARPGSKKGMTGGEIHIHGNAGHAVGARMRRGLIAIAGDIGSDCGLGMIAGTILVGGIPGPAPGTGMKRGSLVLLHPDGWKNESASFRDATRYRPTFLRLYLRQLQIDGFPLPPDAMDAIYQLYRGDFVELGKGEILCRVP